MRLCFIQRPVFSLAVVLYAVTFAGAAGDEETWVSDRLQQPGCNECENSVFSVDCTTCGCDRCCCCDTCCCCDPFVPMMIGAASPVAPRITSSFAGDYTFRHRSMERIADNNSPLPQNRIALSYNLLHNTPKVVGVHPSTIDISQYDLLMEKTLFCESMSVGLNVPFSHNVSTYQDWVTRLPASEDTELGNVSLTLKGLLISRPCLKISGGVLIETPTSDDLTVDVLFDQVEVRETIKQNEWYFSPFLAALATPTDRLFCHGFVSYRDPTGPDDVLLNGEFSPPLRDPDLLMVDGGVGYWLYKSQCCRGLTGLVPTVELHYITTTTDMDGWSGALNRRADYLYLTAGVTTRLGRRNTVALACAVPLREGDNPVLGKSDRLYDWQLALQWNYFYFR
jgi:hypothetical protein